MYRNLNAMGVRGKLDEFNSLLAERENNTESIFVMHNEDFEVLDALLEVISIVVLFLIFSRF